MDKTAATETSVHLFCQTYLGTTITSRFWNLLHVLDVSWPSGYWGTLSGDLLGGISMYPINNHAKFLASFDELYVPHFHQGHLMEVYKLSTLATPLLWGICHFVGIISLWLCATFEIYWLILFRDIDRRCHLIWACRLLVVVAIATRVGLS